jgi:hypothetical protein
MNDEIESRALVVAETDLVPTMLTDIEATKARLEQLQQFVREVMVDGEDYGMIPGVNKPVLLKPGAEKLCEVYGYAQQLEIVNRVEDWNRPFFHYEVRCDLASKRTGRIIGSGVGSCNSMEAKYRWREGQRLCPKCQQPTIIKGKEEYGGGWICYRKKGGCGAKFADDDSGITDQTVGRVENDDVYTLVNTILKMAKKRAVVDATLSVTRSSALFTQDAEDQVEGGVEKKGADKGAQSTQQPQRRSQTKDKSGKANQAQRDMIHMQARKKNIEAPLHDYMARELGVEHIIDLPADQVNAVLKWIELQEAVPAAANA